MARRTHRRGDAASTDVIDSAATAVRAKRLRLELSGVVQRAFAQTKITQTQLARDVGSRQQHLSRWGNANAPHAPTALHLAAAPTAFARPILEWIAAQHDLEVLASASVVHGDDNVARLNVVARACANLSRAVAGVDPVAPRADQLDLFEREATTCAEVAREVKAYAVETKRRARETSR